MYTPVTNIKFSLDIKPFSFNQYLFRSGRRTPKARKWGDEVHNLLKSIEDIESFSNDFDPLKESLHVSIIFFMPVKNLYTKKGTVSKISMDLDNLTKSLLDALFNGKYFKRGLNVFDIDDSQITTLNTSKRISPNDKYSIQFDISKVDHGLNTFK